MRLKYYLEDILGKEVDLVIKDAVKPRLKENLLLRFNMSKNQGTIFYI